MTIETTQDLKNFVVVDNPGRFFILEIHPEEADQAMSTAMTKQAAWLAARSQGKPVTVVLHDQEPKDLGVVQTVYQMSPDLVSTPAIDTTVPAQPKQPVIIVPIGFYLLDGEYYQVVANKDGTKNYAKRMTVENGKRTFYYDKGAIFKLTVAHHVTPDQVKAFGDEHHFCLCCGRKLTVKLSIERGIGPICWEKLGF